MSTSGVTEQSRDMRKVRRAATASFLGSMLEYYDFYIYGSASAVVFDKVFFSETNATTGTLAALATFGVGYVARPIGGVVLGHFGDRLGRKRIMLLTLVLMGSSTFLIGCLPGYHEIGLAAPALLVLLRLVQGFSAGGEQAGTNTLTLEHSPSGKRAYYTSWTLTGTQAGFILASLVFLAVAGLPDRELLSWGWRIPFWCSAVVLAVAYFVRRKLDEPEIFVKTRMRPDDERVPVLVLFASHARDVLRVMLCSFTAIGGSIFSIFALAYATGPQVGMSRTTMLWVAIIPNVCAMVLVPLSAKLADRIGRKPIFITGALGTGASMFGYFWALSTGNLALIVLAAVVNTGFFYSLFIATWPAFFGEMFTTRVRYTGTAIGTQVGFGLAGFAPSLGYAMLGTGPTGWLPVACLVMAAVVVSAIAAATAAETHRTPLELLGTTLTARENPVPHAERTSPGS
jgi:MFS family permease